MRIKTSVTLSADTVKAIDRLARGTGSRSSVVEEAVRELVASRESKERYRRELALLNENADALNREAEDALSFQVDL
jgi:metal-responsive CopG/Arc/MetJ family transcriptional regulator